MESGPLPRFVAGLRGVPARVVGVKVGGRDSAVTITGQGARHLAQLLGGDHLDDTSAPDEALQYALGRRGFGDVTTVREGDNVRISRITLAAAEALARAVADRTP